MKQMRHIVPFLASLMLSIMAFTGCATIMKGDDDTVNLKTSPTGAEVYLDGEMMGTTPLELELKSDRDYLFEFRKAGYEDQVYRIHSELGGIYLVVDLIFLLVPAIVDAYTGDWMVLDPDEVTVPLRVAQ